MGLLCLDDAKHESVRVSYSHTDILTSAPVSFNYTTGIQVTGFPRVHLHISGSLTHQKLKIHNKLTRHWRPHLSVCSLHWCDLLSHQQLKDANFIIASCHTNWECLIYYQHCEELQQMVKLSTIMATVAKEHSVTGFLSPLFSYPPCSSSLIHTIDQQDSKVSFPCSHHF